MRVAPCRVTLGSRKPILEGAFDLECSWIASKAFDRIINGGGGASLRRQHGTLSDEF